MIIALLRLTLLLTLFLFLRISEVIKKAKTYCWQRIQEFRLAIDPTQLEILAKFQVTFGLRVALGDVVGVTEIGGEIDTQQSSLNSPMLNRWNVP
jgi:hypothetical protein